MKYLTFNDKEEIKEALNNGEVISFPTETVYGLGALSTFKGFKNLVKVKQRREDKPFTLMVSDINMIKKYCKLNSLSRKIIEKFMPGSLTVILKAKELHDEEQEKYINEIKNRKMAKNIKVRNLKQFIKRLLLSINIKLYLQMR